MTTVEHAERADEIDLGEPQFPDTPPVERSTAVVVADVAEHVSTVTARALRDYQHEAVGEVRDAWRRGVSRPVVVMATGTGKSSVIGKLAVDLRREGKRVLLLAHQGKLLTQMREAIAAIDPDGAPTGLVKASINDFDHQIVAASLQTLAKPKRLAQIGVFDAVLFDEVHHSSANTFQNVLKELGVIGDSSTTLAAGFTATFNRSEDESPETSLDRIWDEVVFERGMEWAIEHGWLVRPIGRRIVVPGMDLKGVRTTAGDFATGQLGERMEKVNFSVAEVIRQHVPDRRTIVFAVTIAHAQHLAESITEIGIPAAAVWGQMPREQAEQAYADFESGKLRVLTTVALLTEGVDMPWCDCVVMARPTKSMVLAIQAIGRAVRLHEGKTDAIVLDLVEAIPRTGIVSVPDVLGKQFTEEFDADGKQVREPEVDLGEPDIEPDPLPWQTEDEYKGRTAAADIDVLHGDGTPDDKYDYRRYVWMRTEEGIEFLPTRDRTVMVLFPAWAYGSQPTGQVYSILYTEATGPRMYTDDNGVPEVLDEDTARTLAVARLMPISRPAKRSDRFRSSDALPSTAQIRFASSIGKYRPGMTRVQVSDELTKHTVRRMLESRRIISAWRGHGR